MGYEYTGIRDFMPNYDPSDIMEAGVYPFGTTYNLPYDISLKVWDALGGIIAWLINLIFPGNSFSQSLISPEVSNAFAIILMVVVIFAIGFVINLTMLWQERKFLGRSMGRRGTMISPLGCFQ